MSSGRQKAAPARQRGYTGQECSGSSQPLITIAVPSLNQGRYLEQALASIFRQQVPLEVFVMDGGSADESVHIIERWEHRLAGWRSGPDRGQAAAINEGIALGSAPYVCWLNSDDFYLDRGIENLLGALEANSSPQAVYGRCWSVSKSGKKVFPYLTVPFRPWLLANFCFIAQPATLVRRRAWEQLGGLNPDMQLAFDYDLWWRLYREFGRLAYCRKFVAATRMHEQTKTRNQVESHYRESIEVVARHRPRVPLKWRVALPLMKTIRKT